MNWQNNGFAAPHQALIPAEVKAQIHELLLRLGWVSLAGAMARISNRIGLTIKPVILADGRNAIEVDNDRSYRIVSNLIGQVSS